jgi:TM2 domain-containing membrane protein YozV
MFCRNCGAQLDDKAIACIRCGADPRANVSYCNNCGKATPTTGPACLNCGAALSTGLTAHDRASNKIAAGICGILLGSLGVHKFILGFTGAGLTMLLVTILTCGIASPVMGIIGLIEGILYLTKTDEEFVRLYVDGQKMWF